MKKICISVFVVLYSMLTALNTNAQLSVVKNFSTDPFAKKYYQPFLSSKTLFILPYAFEEQLEVFNKAIKEVWTITEIEVITPNAFSELSDENYSVFQIVGVFADDWTNIEYDLYIYKNKQEMKTDKDKFSVASFCLDVDLSRYLEMSNIAKTSYTVFWHKVNEDLEKDLLHKFFYKDTQYTNLLLGHVRTYLRIINNVLLNDANRTFTTKNYFKEVVVSKPELIKELQYETLYIPEHLFVCQKSFFGKITSEQMDKKEMMSAYTYAYQILPIEEIDELIIKSQNPVYYADYFRIGNVPFFLILNSQTSDIIACQKITGCLSKTDFGQIAAKIKAPIRQAPGSPFPGKN